MRVMANFKWYRNIVNKFLEGLSLLRDLFECRRERERERERVIGESMRDNEKGTNKKWGEKSGWWKWNTWTENIKAEWDRETERQRDRETERQRDKQKM